MRRWALVAGALCLALLAAAVTELWRTRADLGLLAARSSDALEGVRAIQAAGLLAGRHKAYGPGYFKLAAGLAALLSQGQRALERIGAGLPPRAAPSVVEQRLAAAGQQQADQERQHLAGMLVSLLALAGIAALVAAHLGGTLSLRLAAGGALGWVLLADPVWATFVLRVHPDLLLALLVAAGTVCWGRAPGPLRLLHSPWLWGGALCFGLALATKPSALLYLPGLTLLWLRADAQRPGWTRQWPPAGRWSLAGRTLRQAAWQLPLVLVAIGLVYLLAAYPQSAEPERTLAFLSRQARFSPLQPFGSAPGLLWSLLQQAWLPSLVLLLAAVLAAVLAAGGRSGSNSGADERPPALWPLAIPLGGLLAHLQLRYLMAVEHYLLPVLAASLPALAGWAAWTSRRCWARARARSRPSETGAGDWWAGAGLQPVFEGAARRWRAVLLVALLALVVLAGAWLGTGRPLFPGLARAADTELADALEQRLLRDWLATELAAGRRVMATPYVPRPAAEAARRGLHRAAEEASGTASPRHPAAAWYEYWNPRLVYLQYHEVELLAVSLVFGRRFAQAPDEYTLATHPAYLEGREFFERLGEGGSFVDQRGQTWLRLWRGRTLALWRRLEDRG